LKPGRRFIAAAVAWIVMALLAILSPYAEYVNEDFRGGVLLTLMFGIIISAAIASRYTVRENEQRK
jgi:di/tricarboxylate transporter